MGLYDDVAGVADHLAGSTDEAVGRQFDDERGGGFADPDTYTDDEQLTARFRDIQDQAKQPWTLLPGATIVNPDNRLGYKDGQNVGGMYDVDQATANAFDVGNEFDWLRDQTPNSGAPSDDPPGGNAHWLFKWLTSNWQLALLAVVGLYILQVLGPVLDLAANATEG